jgi:hypothetical protein
VISTQGKIFYHTKIKIITYGISLRTFTIEIENWLILLPIIIQNELKEETNEINMK